MVAPVLDLALPSDAQLQTAAHPDPWTEAARLTETGRPAQLSELGQQLRQTGTELDRVHEQSWRVQRALASGFANDATAVYDVAAHRQLLPAGVADAGTRLHDVGRRVGVLAQELGVATGDLVGELDRLRAELGLRRSGYLAEIDDARGPDGLIPAARLPVLLARRDAVAAELQALVGGCGRRVLDRIGRYEILLDGCRQLLAELDRPGPAPVDTSGTRLQPILGGRLEGGSGFGVPAPLGPGAEVQPVPPPVPREPGFTPGLAGSGPLVTVPAPDLGAGRQDGPGSGQQDPSPPVRVDAGSAAGSPIAGGRTHRGNFPRSAGPNEILVRYGNDGKVNGYEVYDSDGQPVKRVDVRGRAHGGIDAPHVQEFVRNRHPVTGEEYTQKGEVREARPEEVDGLP